MSECECVRASVCGNTLQFIISALLGIMLSYTISLYGAMISIHGFTNCIIFDIAEFTALLLGS